MIGWSELNPEELWVNVVPVIRKVAVVCPKAICGLKAIGISYKIHGLGGGALTQAIRSYGLLLFGVMNEAVAIGNETAKPWAPLLQYSIKCHVEMSFWPDTRQH
ncbi:MAG TPA: hypothetical protein VKY57_03195 [Chitinispirillaceae bacterium]|nr:hypothetical protein [Chitinispirillaceae bacterium]